MATRTFVVLLVQLLYLVFCCSGELVLYVQSNSSETACPNGTDPTVNCRLLSEYAADPHLSLDVNTTFVFLPGEHVLNTEWYISPSLNGVYFLKMTSAFDGSALVMCNQNVIYFQILNHVEVSSLNFSSCAITAIDVGDTVFRHCRFITTASPIYSLSILFFSNKSSTVEYCSFEDNSGTLMNVLNGSVNFRGNQVTNNMNPYQLVVEQNSNVTLTDNHFANNDGTAVVVTFSLLWLTGTNVFSENYGTYGGVLQCFNCTMVLDGNTTFTNNTGGIGGVLLGILVNLSVNGNAKFIGNTGSNGGALFMQSSQLYFSGNTLFEGNYADYGGALYLVSSTSTILGTANVTFVENLAAKGGAVLLTSGSTLNFPGFNFGSVYFERNHATTRGGAVFIHDYNPVSYCQQFDSSDVGPQQICSFLFSVDLTSHDNLYFYDNHAQEAGSAIYGGTIDLCISNADTFSSYDQFFNRTSFGSTSWDDFNSTSSLISSDPFMLYVCDDNTVNCTNCSISRTAYPGATIEVTVIALGQYSGAVPATVLADYSGWEIRALEDYQGIPGWCTTLSYTIYAQPGDVYLVLYADGPCLTTGLELTVEIEVSKCPPGFTLTTTGIQAACTCDPRLVAYTNSCNPQNGAILRDGKFWVGFDQESNSLILYSSCPFDYCITDETWFKVEDSDAQCNHNREGLLCGRCSDGLSIALGSSRCKRCSNSYVALLLFFAAAGVFLVAFLLVLNLTVAVGTVNGLIFYANIVAANGALIFPSNSNTYLDILRVFIAWINLDFGIESCFYDGMDTYALTWLQYAFPLYIWFLIGLVFVVSHFSTRASRFFGNNPVAVLATLILLSYTKVLRTLIEAFSAASLDYPHGETRHVWLNDGNIPFLDIDDGRHLWLFVSSLLILVFLFIPYTLLLLTSQWLQIKSHWKILSWLNKPQLRAFLDAYHAPYKPRHRYWPGLLLIVRFALQLTVAISNLTNPLLNYLVVQVFVLLVLMWACINGGIYRKWYLNVLEAFFFLNLGVLAASTHHINSQFTSFTVSSHEDERSQAAATSTLVTVALVTFTGIVIFHTYLLLKGKCPKLVHTKYQVPPAVPTAFPSEEDPLQARLVTSIGLRESILDGEGFGACN